MGGFIYLCLVIFHLGFHHSGKKLAVCRSACGDEDYPSRTEKRIIGLIGTVLRRASICRGSVGGKCLRRRPEKLQGLIKID
jgi:hypothetical protein